MDPSTAKYGLDWYVSYDGCPNRWPSKLKMLVALSTTMFEYIALSNTLHDLIIVMQVIEEITKNGLPILCAAPYIYCKTFEVNLGASELASLPKLQTCTEHINI